MYTVNLVQVFFYMTISQCYFNELAVCEEDLWSIFRGKKKHSVNLWGHPLSLNNLLTGTWSWYFLTRTWSWNFWLGFLGPTLSAVSPQHLHMLVSSREVMTTNSCIDNIEKYFFPGSQLCWSGLARHQPHY